MVRSGCSVFWSLNKQPSLFKALRSIMNCYYVMHRILSAVIVNGKSYRAFSRVADTALREELKITAWQIHSYGDDPQISTLRMPVVQHPKSLLVQIDAASVNPIDVLMCSGYGRTLINLIRREEEFPLTLGRDFCGTIISRGHAANKSFKVGDRVYGFKPLHEQGTFAEAVLVDDSYVRHQPAVLTHTESASLVYASMTAWSGLFITGGLMFKKTDGVRVLILGASGGVGTAAVQLLKSQKCKVFATCSEDAIPLVKSLGADAVFNYKHKDFCNEVANQGRYHIILDCAKFGDCNIPTSWNYDIYVALNSPLLVNTDQYGLTQGLCRSASSFLQSNVKQFGRKFVRWGFFMPIESGFTLINELIGQRKIRPCIHKTFKFNELPEALKTVSAGHLRGKIVVDFT